MVLGRHESDALRIHTLTARGDPGADMGLTTEATEDTELVKPGVRPVSSIISVCSVVQYRIQGADASLTVEQVCRTI